MDQIEQSPQVYVQQYVARTSFNTTLLLQGCLGLHSVSVQVTSQNSPHCSGWSVIAHCFVWCSCCVCVQVASQQFCILQVQLCVPVMVLSTAALSNFVLWCYLLCLCAGGQPAVQCAAGAAVSACHGAEHGSTLTLKLRLGGGGCSSSAGSTSLVAADDETTTHTTKCTTGASIRRG